MAGGNAKRISAQNTQTLQYLRLGFLSTFAIYILHLLLFRSGRTWTRLFLYLLTEGVGLGLWRVLEGMGAKGEDLKAAGLTTYMFDIVYVTWIVHILAALITAKAWYLYLSIPIYAIYRLSSFVLPYLGFGGAKAPVGTPAGYAPGAKKGAVAEEPAAVSKRQAKLAERQKKGPVRVGY